MVFPEFMNVERIGIEKGMQIDAREMVLEPWMQGSAKKSQKMFIKKYRP